jgi:hypothetical protein
MISQDALISLLIAEGIFTREEFLEMVRVADREGREAEVKQHNIPCRIPP